MKVGEFHRLYEYEFIDQIQRISSQSAVVKQEIFKSMMQKKYIDKQKIKIYLSFVSDFLKFWEDYSTDLQEKISRTTGIEGVCTIKYQDIKDFIYANYDYASIIPYVDGLIKGIESSKFKEPEDVNDFFVHTVSKAYDELPDSIAGLLDHVTGESIFFDKNFRSDKYEAKMFETVKSYKKMFNTTSRTVLYKAITKAIEFITDEEAAVKLGSKTPRLYVSVVNNIIEYISYSMAVYAVRIYTISCYAYPYIDSEVRTATPVAMKEATEEKELPTINNDLDSVSLTIMHEADEAKYKNIENIKELIQLMNKFIASLGADSMLGTRGLTYGRYYSKIDMVAEPNNFGEKLIHNDLFIFLDTGIDCYTSSPKEKDMIETNQVIKSMLYNNKQGLGGTFTHKQELLHIIRGVSCDNTIKGYQKLAVSLAKLNFFITGRIEDGIKYVNRWKDENYPHKEMISIGTQNAVKETLKMYNELYGDVVAAVIQKAKEIEKGYNAITVKQSDAISKSLDLDITAGGITSVVPDTTRMPIDLINMYSLPAFEEMQMYDDYLKSLPMFESDMYFSEALNISGVMNKIISFIANPFKKFSAFYKNEKVKKALDWVAKNKSKIEHTNLEAYIGKEMLPYPEIKDKSKSIDPTKGYKNLVANIGNYKPEDPNFDLDKYITSLYPSKTVQEWFNDPKTGSIKYHNYIKFNQDENSASDQVQSGVKLTKENVVNAINGCISSIEGLEKVYASLDQTKRELDGKVNEIKNKVVAATNKQGGNEPVKDNVEQEKDNKDSNQNKPGENTQDTQQKSEQSGNDAANKMQSSTNSNPDSVLPAIETAIQRLWNPIGTILVDTITDQYKHIKAAYEAGNAGSSE